MDERRGKRRPDERPDRRNVKPAQQQDPRRRNQELRRRKEMEMRRRIRKRRKRRKRILVLLLLLLILAVAAGIVLWIRYGPSKEKADKNEYFGINATNQVGMTIDNQIPEVKSMKEGSQIYLDFDSVHDFIGTPMKTNCFIPYRIRRLVYRREQASLVPGTGRRSETMKL